MISNTIYNNVATWDGGGATIRSSHLDFSGNVVISNTARDDEHHPDGYGGGLAVWSSTILTATHNTFVHNTSNSEGAALWLNTGYGRVDVSSNLFLSNTVQGCGAGVFLIWSKDVSTQNNVFAYNRATDTGGAVTIWNSVLKSSHDTFIANSDHRGAAIGFATNLAPGGYLYMTNTVMSRQAVGIVDTRLDPMTWITLTGILWHDVTTPTLLSEAVVYTATHEYYGDPAFAADGYHLTAGSAALNRGVPTDVLTDIDGESRPSGLAPDLGADEFQDRYQVYLPLVMRGH